MRNLTDGLALLGARRKAVLTEATGAGVFDGMRAGNDMTDAGFGH